MRPFPRDTWSELWSSLLARCRVIGERRYPTVTEFRDELETLNLEGYGWVQRTKYGCYPGCSVAGCAVTLCGNG